LVQTGSHSQSVINTGKIRV